VIYLYFERFQQWLARRRATHQVARLGVTE